MRDQSAVLAGTCRLEPSAGGGCVRAPRRPLWARHRARPAGNGRAFAHLRIVVLVDLGLVLVNRSFATSLGELIGKANRALVWVSAVTVALLALVLITPFGRTLFRFGPLHSDDLTLVVVIVVAIFATLEFLKRFWRVRLIT